jgi:hypothetical protein
MKKDPAASADPAFRAQLEFKGTVLCRGSGMACPDLVERQPELLARRVGLRKSTPMELQSAWSIPILSGPSMTGHRAHS